MSTKNLARSVIEGGRYFHNALERRESHRAVRTHVRDRLAAVRLDPDSFEDQSFGARCPVHRMFHDKLGPAHRFLDSRVGKSWNKTRSLIAERFDTRTTAGRHIVFDHLLQEVAISRSAVDRPWLRYYVDRHGILRRVERKRQRHVFEVVPVQWLGNRKLGRMGSFLVWFEPTRDAELVVAGWTGSKLVYLLRDGRSIAHVGFRQAAPLDDGERAYFESLSPRVQRAILATAPVA